MNLVIVGLIVFFLLRPGGLVASALGRWKAEKAQRGHISRAWNALVSEGGVIGNLQTARYEIIEFGDYQCRFCASLNPQLASFVANHPEVVIRYRQYPLPASRFGGTAAIASICSESQGAFERLHNQFFARPDWSEEPDWPAEAALAGITDSAGFAACLVSPAAFRRLQRDKMLADSLGITGTPTLIGQSGLMVGLATEEDLLALAHASVRSSAR